MKDLVSFVHGVFQAEKQKKETVKKKKKRLSEIWQRKTLYQVNTDHDFLEIYCLIKSKVVSIIAPHQVKNFFFSKGKK